MTKSAPLPQSSFQEHSQSNHHQRQRQPQACAHRKVATQVREDRFTCRHHTPCAHEATRPPVRPLSFHPLRAFGRQAPPHWLSAAAARRSTRAYGEVSGPGGPAFGIHVSNQGRFMIVAGGVPLFVSEEIVGGVGCSSGTPDQDEVVAQAGIDTFLKTLD